MSFDLFRLPWRTATTVLALIGLISWRETFAISCDDLPLPSLTLRLKEAPVTLDTTYDYKSISVLASKEHHREHQVLGLTKGIARIQYRVESRVVVDPTRRWECVSPQITVTYGFDPMTVYVAREFPQGSCAFNEIYRHEQKHVQTYRNHLAAIEKDMAETLANRFETGSLYRGPVGQTRLALEKEFSERWMPYLRREIDRAELLQAQIDTPEEYERVSRSCDGAIQRVIR